MKGYKAKNQLNLSLSIVATIRKAKQILFTHSSYQPQSTYFHSSYADNLIIHYCHI